jgi:hypothetical protein
LAKQAKKKTTHRPRKPQAEKPLPPPVDPGASSELPMPQLAKEGGSMFDLGAIFQHDPYGATLRRAAQMEDGDSSIPSANSSTANGEPMAADAARLLGGVPDSIGESGQDAPAHQGEPMAPPSVSAGTVIISAETMQPLLLWLTDKLAVWRRIEAYRLNDAGATMLAGPYSQVLNGLWDKLAPAFLSQLCVSVPGLAEAAALSAVAFWPAVQEEMKRGRAIRGAVPQKPAQAAPPQTERGGMIYEGGKAE